MKISPMVLIQLKNTLKTILNYFTAFFFYRFFLRMLSEAMIKSLKAKKPVSVSISFYDVERVYYKNLSPNIFTNNLKNQFTSFFKLNDDYQQTQSYLSFIQSRLQTIIQDEKRIRQNIESLSETKVADRTDPSILNKSE